MPKKEERRKAVWGKTSRTDWWGGTESKRDSRRLSHWNQFLTLLCL